MIEEEAIVISKDKEFAEVDIIRTKPCGLCGKTQGCGNSIWGKVFSFKKRKIQFTLKYITLMLIIGYNGRQTDLYGFLKISKKLGVMAQR